MLLVCHCVPFELAVRRYSITEVVFEQKYNQCEHTERTDNENDVKRNKRKREREREIWRKMNERSNSSNHSIAADAMHVPFTCEVICMRTWLIQVLYVSDAYSFLVSFSLNQAPNLSFRNGDSCFFGQTAHSSGSK